MGSCNPMCDHQMPEQAKELLWENIRVWCELGWPQQFSPRPGILSLCQVSLGQSVLGKFRVD